MDFSLLGLQRFDQIKTEFGHDLKHAILTEIAALPRQEQSMMFAVRVDAISRCWADLAASDPGFEQEPDKEAVKLGLDLDLVDPDHPDSPMSARHQIKTMAFVAQILAESALSFKFPDHEDTLWLCIETMAKRWIELRDEGVDLNAMMRSTAPSRESPH